MGRTKGALNKKTIEKQISEKIEQPKVVTEDKKEESCMKNKVIVPINQNLMVEGFNPDNYKQYYPNGKAYLPFQVQLVWFRLKYPNGKTPIFRPDLVFEKTPNTYEATARIYRDASDPVDSYLSEASAKRGPEVKSTDGEFNLDPYTDVQRAALSMALRIAGFWCSLTEDDLTKELETPEEEKADTKTTKEDSEKSTGKDNSKEEKPVTKVEDKKKTSKSSKKATESKQVDGEKVEENSDEIPKEDNVQGDIVKEDDTSIKTTELEGNSESEVVKDNDVLTDKTELEENSNPEVVINPEEASVSDDIVKDVSSKEDSSNEEQLSDSESTQEQDIPNNIEDPVEELDSETEEEDIDETPKELTPEEAAELEEIRAIPFTNGYYNGNLGDLEEKKINNITDGVNLFKWLMRSAIAKNKYPKQQAGVNRIAELCHPEWLEEDLD